MDCSTPGFPVYHQLLELAQTHVHRVGDAIQPSLPLSSPSPPALQSFPAVSRPWQIDGIIFPISQTKQGSEVFDPGHRGAGPLWLCCQWLLRKLKKWQEVILNPKVQQLNCSPISQSPFPISSSQHH
ncbi:hypothetical protein DPEC_G00370260 [Dallia pectoralis]|nr:hypothetical protein DPEC_G00370260 [Dallia pectoralis]